MEPEWLSSYLSFVAWLTESQNDMLWLRGYAGVGKSVITKYLIIDVLKAKYIESRKLPSCDKEQSLRHGDFLAYFFCSERRRHLQPESNILMSTLHQLLSAAPQDVSKAFQVYRRSSLIYSFLFQPEDLWDAVKSALVATNWTTIYLVFDGLDEMLAEDLEDFSKGLKVLVERVTPRIEPRSLKTLITSRPIANLDMNFSCPSISMDIVDRISEKANGMFLWAVLAWYELCRNARRAEDFAANLLELRKLLATLEMLYENILNRLPISSRQLALKTVSRLTLSARPLHGDELRFAIAMAETTDSYETAVRRMIARQKLKHCVLTHSIALIPVKLHSAIAIACVQSLYMPGFDVESIQAELTETEGSSESQMVGLPWRYLLLPDAVTNWYYHASMAGEDLKVWTAFKTLLEHGNSTKLWLMLALYEGSLSAQRGWKLSKHFWNGFANPSAIHIAVFLENA
ncbi:uncharacterized protein A1O9_02147 [Exophiala aquamarina CBS 119918]|uniref:NACHT domain-containing protein n=1 Tax=Exophiala aquamarina CBS 119918 TaxID=1182545 RepID=A0A072PL24_9EURO|nr:uncharacterized protein A1O9_02147 [Exophiala aquamarina CBS 119918]KEF60586.1 hypothetical protein A1O9_02147 [Exophiala aquamarina CBS 119918]